MIPIIRAGGRLSSRAIDRACSRGACVVAHVAWSDEVLGAYGASSCEDDAYGPYVEGLGIDWQGHRLLSAMPGRRRDGTAVVVVTLAPPRRPDPRTYEDVAPRVRRAARARRRGYDGPGAIARYRADVAAGVAIDPPPPAEDVEWARATE